MRKLLEPLGKSTIQLTQACDGLLY
jgi:hypothetical protein